MAAKMFLGSDRFSFFIPTLLGEIASICPNTHPTVGPNPYCGCYGRVPGRLKSLYDRKRYV
jgi:hypothetical protein